MPRHKSISKRIYPFLFLIFFMFFFWDEFIMAFPLLFIAIILFRWLERNTYVKNKKVIIGTAKKVEGVSKSQGVICPSCGSRKVVSVNGKLQCGDCGYKEL